MRVVRRSLDIVSLGVFFLLDFLGAWEGCFGVYTRTERMGRKPPIL